jgi:major membrane immunogen (membrane-anchored lipoprotein)
MHTHTHTHTHTYTSEEEVSRDNRIWMNLEKGRRKGTYIMQCNYDFNDFNLKIKNKEIEYYHTYETYNAILQSKCFNIPCTLSLP